MRLPGAAAYMEALQDPASCFADPDLAGGVAVLGPLGLPRAVSGNVAVVFRVDSPDGRSWAVRCFVRPVDEERARYGAIRSHLDGLSSTWRVPFDLQPCGIRIDGAWWPVLKMDWAPGEPLLAYVGRHLWDGAALGYLAARFGALSARLRDDGVAHGDLQHGNILVTPGGDLRLVDYDGMYVPGLAGRSGTERGHRNYQHPDRVVSDFGPGLDSFSAWVIYGSLVSLAADPLLWGRLDGGEEALLLRHHDLEEPHRSAALAAMEASDGPGVAQMAGVLRSFLAVRPGDVPPLSPGLIPALTCAVAGASCVPRAVADGAGAGRPPTNGSPGAEEDRRRSLYDALTARAPSTGSGAGPPGPPGPGREPMAFDGDLHDARVAVAAGAGAVLAILVVAGLLGASPLVSLVAVAALGGATLARVNSLFRRTPEAQEAREAGVVLAGPRRAVDETQATFDSLSRRRAEIATEEAAAASRSEAARQELRDREAQELRQVDAGLDAALATVVQGERAVAKAEQEARASALAELQASVMKSQLSQYSLVSAEASGVSNRVVYRLALDQVRTAADFTAVMVEKTGGVVISSDGRRLSVSGVDQQQAAAMLAWRRRMSGVAQLKVPDALPREQLAAIRARHDAMRACLSEEAEAARSAAKRRADGIRAAWEREHDQVLQRQKQVEIEAARQRVELDRQLTHARKDVAEAEWRLGQRHGETGGPAQLRLGDYLREVVAVGPLASVAGRRRP